MAKRAPAKKAAAKKQGSAAGARPDVASPGYRLDQKLVAELVGTFTVMFVSAASILAAAAVGGGAGGAGLVTVALAPGLAIGVMVSALGHLSGGHFNPAVTFGLAIAGRLRAVEALAYWVAQLVGAVAAAGLLRAAVPESVWKPAKLGATLLGADITMGQGVLIEAVLTFFLVTVVFGTAVDPDGALGKSGGLAIGFAVGLGIMTGGPFTGASMNPARSLAPALAGGYWDDQWVYWAGPLLGAALAALLYASLLVRSRSA